jgi:predicted anti-sigma-YlaC factor YlaD
MSWDNCRNVRMNYMRRFYVGLLDHRCKVVLFRHLDVCTECKERFEQLGKEPDIGNICHYCQDQMYRYIRGGLDFLVQEKEIEKHLELCQLCRDFRREVIRRMEELRNKDIGVEQEWRIPEKKGVGEVKILREIYSPEWINRHPCNMP